MVCARCRDTPAFVPSVFDSVCRCRRTSAVADEQAVHADDITFEEGVDKKEGLVSEKELEKSTALFKLFKKQEIGKSGLE